MNYLAHILLSGRSPGMQLGGFIADFVKGNRLHRFPEPIRRGIALHRQIDSFTDNHEHFRSLVLLLRPAFGKYSGIIADMYFDHFLALHFSRYSKLPLRLFSWRFYLYAILHYYYLPARVKRFIFHFTGTNRLMKYRNIEGLHDSLSIMSKYKSSALNPEKIILFLDEHYQSIGQLFMLFFPEVQQFAAHELKTHPQNRSHNQGIAGRNE
jgi:acyl carrier protein phosphodiesterase